MVVGLINSQVLVKETPNYDVFLSKYEPQPDNGMVVKTTNNCLIFKVGQSTDDNFNSQDYSASLITTFLTPFNTHDDLEYYKKNDEAGEKKMEEFYGEKTETVVKLLYSECWAIIKFKTI